MPCRGEHEAGDAGRASREEEPAPHRALCPRASAIGASAATMASATGRTRHGIQGGTCSAPAAAVFVGLGGLLARRMLASVRKRAAKTLLEAHMLGSIALVLMASQGTTDGAWTTFQARARVAQGLESELGRDARDAAGVASAGERLKRLHAALERAAGELGQGSRMAATLRAEAQPRDVVEDPAKELSRLTATVRERALDLGFTPLVESPRPTGFPESTPVGEIVVLEYPAYRMARTDMPRSGFVGRNGAFWRLFRHIESRSIPMTAPVEMTYGTDTRARRMERMAFLYADLGVGKLGRDGEVEVVDVPAARVVSIGLRGGDERRFEKARTELDAWLAAHPEWTVCGPARVMAWNSPMVPDARRFHEVQIQIRPAHPASLGQAGN